MNKTAVLSAWTLPFAFISGFTWTIIPITGLPETRVKEITRDNWLELKRQMVADGFFDK